MISRNGCAVSPSHSLHFSAHHAWLSTVADVWQTRLSELKDESASLLSSCKPDKEGELDFCSPENKSGCYAARNHSLNVFLFISFAQKLQLTVFTDLCDTT